MADNSQGKRHNRPNPSGHASVWLTKHPGTFAWRVLREFKRNQGMLLSGAVAYYGLLSIIPLLALLLVGLSHFIPEAALLTSVQAHLEIILPVNADTMTHQIAAFLEYRNVIGWVGTAILIFFATMAFTVLENAMSVIFFHRVEIHRRHFLVSALIPFVFIVLLGMGVVVVTLVSGALQGLEREYVTLFGYTWMLEGASGVVLYLLGVLGLILLLTSLYLVMPVGQIAFHHALIGGFAAAILWEITRHILVWYFTSLSLVNLVYGSLATAVVVLLSFEFAAIILLLGAQVIAEFERGVAGDDAGFNT